MKNNKELSIDAILNEYSVNRLRGLQLTPQQEQLLVKARERGITWDNIADMFKKHFGLVNHYNTYIRYYKKLKKETK